MSLIQPLFKGNIDIVGDIHGELDALVSLVKELGYDMDGNHPENRKLIFVGDLVDRGPDSPGVIRFVKNLIEKGNAQAILGNHEMNVLQHKVRSGAGWFFEQQIVKDKVYQPFNVTKEEERAEIYEFLSNLPVGLENDELRIIHAAWVPEKIEQIRNIPLGDVGKAYVEFEQSIMNNIRKTGLLDNYHAEQDEWQDELEDSYAELPFLNHTCEYNLAHQMHNPLRVLTSGVEKRAEEKFFASGKWRFVQRHNWWETYTEDVPVIIGHFWRKLNHVPETTLRDEDVFDGIAPNEWHGANKNVFCVDYSVGARFLERKNNAEFGTYGRLGAFRWPEKEICFEDGFRLKVGNKMAFKK